MSGFILRSILIILFKFSTLSMNRIDYTKAFQKQLQFVFKLAALLFTELAHVKFGLKTDQSSYFHRCLECFFHKGGAPFLTKEVEGVIFINVIREVFYLICKGGGRWEAREKW